MATQNLTTSAISIIYIHEPAGDYEDQQSSPSANLIDGVFTIPDHIDTLTLQDKLSQRLNQLYAATNPSEDQNATISSEQYSMDIADTGGRS